MRVRTAGMLAAAAIVLMGPITAGAMADGPVGADPSSNFAVGSLPPACDSEPTGAVCIDAAVSYLDQARASLGQPPYTLPSDFDSLSPDEQAFVLTNLDRVLYGLPPVPGLTAQLDQDAAAGVQEDEDPQPSDSNWWGYTANWAYGFDNMPLAYEAWMYDDGPGSGNLDCTSSDTSGCWGHRHDILWSFDGGGALAMGAAAGDDPSGAPGYTMLIEEGDPQTGTSYTYTYTWSEAVADGASATGSSSGSLGSSGSQAGSGAAPGSAGSGSGSTPAKPAKAGTALRVAIKIHSVRVHGHRVTVTIANPVGTLLRCSLMRRTAHGARLARAESCAHLVTFSHLPAGRYRLKVTSAQGTLTRQVLVH
jgi:hypothetical protein